jgi:hypothetical protein
MLQNIKQFDKLGINVDMKNTFKIRKEVKFIRFRIIGCNLMQSKGG